MYINVIFPFESPRDIVNYLLIPLYREEAVEVVVQSAFTGEGNFRKKGFTVEKRVMPSIFLSII